MTATEGEWFPEIHTGLPEGFSLYRREEPEYDGVEYRVGFRAAHTVSMSREREADREFRNVVLQDALHSLAHFIEAKTKEISA